MRRGVLVLDMDGTVVLGDDPVRRYATAAAAVLERRHPGRGGELERAVDGYLAGDPAVDDAPDGYQAVARTALRLGLTGPELDAAAAEVIDAPESLQLWAPPALPPLLAELRRSVRIVVASNGSDDWIEVALARVGVADLVDETHGSLRKPAGLQRLVQGLLEHSGWIREPWRMFGVGDIWVNDLEPIAAVGGETALVDRFGRAGGEPTHRAAEFAGLEPAIRAWATRVE